jgi:[protein-PII] uridylyltransferase
VWTHWKAVLVDELVQQCHAVLAGGQPPGPDPLSDEQVALAERTAASGKVGLLLAGDGPGAVITVVAPDRSGLLARAAGVLALNSLEVHAASVRGHQDVAVDVFTVSPRFGRLPDRALLREQLQRAVDGSLPLAEKITAKENDYAQAGADAPEPRALWFDDEATGAAVLEVRSADRIGLLYRVAAALDDSVADVRWARLSTPGATAIGAYCLTVDHGRPDDEARGRIAASVLAAIR